MSLLMEALKKAEQAKQAAQGTASGDDRLRLEPVDTGAGGAPAGNVHVGNSLPDLPPQLEILDAEFIAHAETDKATIQKKADHHVEPHAPSPVVEPPPGIAPAPPRAAPRPTPRPAAAPPAADNAARLAAQQVFSAKQPERSRSVFYVTLGVGALVATAAIGGYFWWQLQPKSGLAVQQPLATLPATPPAQTPAPPPQLVTPPPLPAPLAAAPAPVATPQAESGYDGNKPRRQAAAPLPGDSDGPVRISKSQLKINPGATLGYEALNRGDLATAKQEYLRLYEAEPKNGDALRGLAAVAIRQGDAAAAGDWYLKALEADPKDAAAQAGLIGLRGHGGEPGDPLALESRLKSLIAAQPDVGALHFALGNIFARQNRWSEAQQAFFKAFSAEPQHPDYAFNLAVSLDHLRQGRIAAQYYNQALALATQRPSGFDKAQVATRLREIQP